MSFQTFLEGSYTDSIHPVFKKGETTLSHVKMSLHRGGYEDHSDIKRAEFSHMHGDKEVHKITYPSPEHEGMEEGHVYIDKDGKADF